jgi:hypothetical protein
MLHRGLPHPVGGCGGDSAGSDEPLKAKPEGADSEFEDLQRDKV